MEESFASTASDDSDGFWVEQLLAATNAGPRDGNQEDESAEQEQSALLDDAEQEEFLGGAEAQREVARLAELHAAVSAVGPGPGAALADQPEPSAEGADGQLASPASRFLAQRRNLFDEEMAAAETELDAIRAAQDRWKDAEGADGDDSRPSSAISTVSTQLSFATELSDASVFDMGGTFDLGGFEVGGAAEGEARYDSRMDSSSCSSESQLSAAQLASARDGGATPPLRLLVPTATEAAYSTLASTGALEIAFDELTLHEMLDAGAGAEVYRAEYKGVEVAVKRFHRQDSFEADPKALQKVADELKNEVAALQAIQSPRVLRIHGVCIEPPNISIVMQLAHKGCLHKVLHRDPHPVGGARAGDGSMKPNAPPAEVAKALRMLLDCAEGMCTIHASGMVHRDLKTHNLLVDQNDRVIVGDLGMTHRLEENTGQVLANRGTADAPPGGTVAYMAPEVLRAEVSSGTVLADVYSFGVCAWEMFSGLEPWVGRTPCQIALEVGKGRSVMAVHGKPLGMPSAMAQLAQQCMQPDPTHRPAFAQIAERLKAMVMPLTAAVPLGSGLATPGEAAKFWEEMMKGRARRGEFVPPHLRRHIELKMKEANRLKKKAANRPPAVSVLPEVEESAAEISPAGAPLSSASHGTGTGLNVCRTCGAEVEVEQPAAMITTSFVGRHICASCEERLAALSGVGPASASRAKPAAAEASVLQSVQTGPFEGSVLQSVLVKPKNAGKSPPRSKAPPKPRPSKSPTLEPAPSSAHGAAGEQKEGTALLDQLIASAVSVQASRSSTKSSSSVAPTREFTTTPKGAGPSVRSSASRPAAVGGDAVEGRDRAKEATAAAQSSKESVAELAASMATSFVSLQPHLGLDGGAHLKDEAPSAFTHESRPAACRIGSTAEPEANLLGMLCSSESAEELSSSSLDESLSPRVAAAV